MSVYDLPQDLRDASIAPHRTQPEYTFYARNLPWSAEPMAGWEAGKQLRSGYRSSWPDSPATPMSSTNRSPLFGPGCWSSEPR